jgi:hypothetical protein
VIAKAASKWPTTWKFDAVEREAWFGAVPGDELVDAILVHTARSRRAEAVEHGPLTMIQVRQSKQTATIIRLDSLFAHSDGLPCRRISGIHEHLAPFPGEHENAHDRVAV